MKGKYIYLDNAATTFPKPESVIKRTVGFMRREAANPGRGSHKLSLLASESIYSVRESISDFLGISEPERVVFTPGATFALNLAIKTGVKSGDHVLISDLEHNSVLRAVHSLSLSHEVTYSVFSTDDPEESIRKLVTSKTTHLISTLASNIDGRRVDIRILSRISREYGLKLILDASQLLGHTPIHLSGIEFDVLCSAGHKALFGYPGVGFAVFGNKSKRSTFLEGGSGSSSKEPVMPELLPERFEAGTLPTVSIISLGAGIDHIRSTGLDKIENFLTTCTEELKARLSFIKGIEHVSGNLGTVMFTHKEISSEALAERLDAQGFAVRGGFHCAPLAHKTVGTYENGAVRVSFSHLNKRRDIDLFENALLKAIKK